MSGSYPEDHDRPAGPQAEWPDAACDRPEAARCRRVEDSPAPLTEASGPALLRELPALEVALQPRGGAERVPDEFRARFADRGAIAAAPGEGSGLETDPGSAGTTDPPPSEPSTVPSGNTITVSGRGTDDRRQPGPEGGPAAGPGAPTAADDRDRSPGSIGRYQIAGVLGQGGFGQVFLAVDTELGRRVALKLPHPGRLGEPADADAFLAEARLLAGLDHPGIVPVYDAGQADDGRPYIVSKYIDGSDLKDVPAAGRPRHAEAAALIATVAEALHHAHSRRLVHRDVKPRNILIDREGRPYLTDFGLALRDEDFGRGPNFTGTVDYMSPEQARGEGHLVDGRSDIFSLGVVLYELLTGTLPFRGAKWTETLERIQTLDARPPRQLDDRIPKDLECICLKALSKRLADRYSTALDMAEDLRQVASPADDRVAPRRPAIPPADGGAEEISALPDAIVPKGLRCYGAEDADFFLGLLPGPRDRAGLPECLRFWKTRVEDLDGDRTFRIGLAYGPSGCGKSSLVRAGLLPRLDPRVVPVIIEATPDGTEARLAAEVRKRCPRLPSDLSPARLVAAVRRGHDLPAGRKLLIVLDQFEQWLHAHRTSEESELIRSLRQCDGARVQALLIVRDDFWMSVTRFFQDLDVQLAEGQNSAAVDLFDTRHAAKVLVALGRAFGAVPAAPAEPTREQRAFVDQAVADLAQDGKISPVRLSLFAEMVKRRAWTPATLRGLGGARGVGEAFLEETFSAAVAPPLHRLHQHAVRAVLKALLPDAGSDIKGRMRPRGELLAASGYADRPASFDALIRILDSEVRLITPADELPDRGAGEPAASSGLYYQLTHDHMVPSIRQWLARKRRESHRGRAEIRLSELAALWDARPQRRLLPSAWEFLDVILFTSWRAWTPPQRRMMKAAAVHHAARGAATMLVLAGLALAGAAGYGRMRAAALHDRLLQASIADVPAIVREIGGYRRWLDPMLARDLAGSRAGGDGRTRLHASLALLPVDTNQLAYLRRRLLDAEPDEFLVIRAALAPRRDALSEDLWGVWTDSRAGNRRRFRAACALAAFTPSDRRWGPAAPEVAARLTLENPLAVSRWLEALRPVRGDLVPPLRKVYGDPERTEEQRFLAASVLASFLAHDGEALAALALTSTPRQLAALLPAMAAHRDRVAGLLEAELGRDAPPEAHFAEKDDLAEHQAGIAAALVGLGRGERAWPLLRQSPEPRLRTGLIHRLAPAEIDPHLLAERLAREPDASARRSLVLSLGEFDQDRFSPGERDALIRAMLAAYRDDPDPGLHAAADWLLRRWGQADAAAAVDAARISDGPRDGRRWYVGPNGHTFAVIPGPVDSSIEEGPGTRRVRIPRSFAVATKETTIAQLARSRGAGEAGREAPPDLPAGSVTWYEAARYCRWLSEREGLPEDQMCYPPIDQIGPGMRPYPDYLRRRGYRLPTEAEWEYACRAGTTTIRHYGTSDRHLRHYAWSVLSSDGHPWPVGRLKPNDLGMFDILGNLLEWTHAAGAAAGLDRAGEGFERLGEAAMSGRAPLDGPLFIDREDASAIVETSHQWLRGAAYESRLVYVRVSYRNPNPPSRNTPSIGFRVARTCN